MSTPDKTRLQAALEQLEKDESFKDGKGVTLPGFGGFFVRPEPESWVFKFIPGQRLRALFDWPSTYSGTL